MDTFELITASYSSIAALGTLQSVGITMLSVALAVSLIIQLYRHVVGGQSDFITPIVRVGLAIACLTLIRPIGDFFAGSAYALSNMLFSEDLFDLANQVWSNVMRGVEDPGVLDYVAALFSPMFWLCLGTYLQLITVAVIKIAIVDVLWPVMFGLVLFSGSLSIPLGLFPGVSSFKGWALNLCEIAIWPIVFQILATMLLACFQGQLTRMNDLALVWEKNDELEANAEALENLGADGKAQEFRAQIDKNAKSKWGTLLRYWAINTAFLFLTLFVPLIARKIVRGESAGAIGGIMTAVAARLGYGAVKRTVQTADAVVSDGSTAGQTRRRNAEQDTASPEQKQKTTAQRLDARR
jgi:hypothetical protein